MSLFGGQDLFGSGPHRFEVGGLELRHTTHAPVGSAESRGVSVQSFGVSARPITQTGELIADDPQRLSELVHAIESMLDGQGRELIDERGQAWPDTVMTAFTPGPTRRLGARWHTPYRILYTQVTP